MNKFEEKYGMRPKGGVKMVKCDIHGLIKPREVCGECAKEIVLQNRAFQTELAKLPEMLRSLANDHDKAKKRNEGLEFIIGEISRATHQQYCVDGLHGSLPEGEHHQACSYITEMMGELDKETINANIPATAAEPPPAGQDVDTSASSVPSGNVGGNRLSVVKDGDDDGN